MIMQSTKRLPAFFISHGSPAAVLQEDGFTEVMAAMGRSLRDAFAPRAIVVVSAHGQSPEGEVAIDASSRPRAIHDFRGFQPALYQMDYPCPGSPEIAARLAGLLSAAGFAASLDTSRFMDHGVWMPLKLMFPEADLPVVQITMPYPSSPEHLLKLGRAIAPLREEGALLIGTGGLVHNLGQLSWHEKNSVPVEWAQEFEAWVLEHLSRKDVGTLCDFEAQAPHAKLAHPEPEHFYPIFFTLGASLPGDQPYVYHREIQYKSLSMSGFALSPDGVGLPASGVG